MDQQKKYAHWYSTVCNPQEHACYCVVKCVSSHTPVMSILSLLPHITHTHTRARARAHITYIYTHTHIMHCSAIILTRRFVPTQNHFPLSFTINKAIHRMRFGFNPPDRILYQLAVYVGM